MRKDAATRPVNLKASKALKRLLQAKKADAANRELDAAEEDVKKNDDADKEHREAKVKMLTEAEDRVKAAALNLAGCQKKLMDAQADLDRMKAGNPVTQQAAVPGEATLEGAAALRPSPSRPPQAPRHREPRPPESAPTIHQVVRLACRALRDSEGDHDGLASMLEEVMAAYQ